MRAAQLKFPESPKSGMSRTSWRKASTSVPPCRQSSNIELGVPQQELEGLLHDGTPQRTGPSCSTTPGVAQPPTSCGKGQPVSWYEWTAFSNGCSQTNGLTPMRRCRSLGIQVCRWSRSMFRQIAARGGTAYAAGRQSRVSVDCAPLRSIAAMGRSGLEAVIFRAPCDDLPEGGSNARAPKLENPASGNPPLLGRTSTRTCALGRRRKEDNNTTSKHEAPTSF